MATVFGVQSFSASVEIQKLSKAMCVKAWQVARGGGRESDCYTGEEKQRC